MSGIDTAEIRRMAQAANETGSNDAAITWLHAVELLCDPLDTHQHSYYGSERDSRGMGGKWLNTGPKVEDDSGHRAYMKAHATKYQAKT